MSEELKELRNIRKLLILLLMQNEVGQDKIARVLGVDQSAVSHMLNPRSKAPPTKNEKNAIMGQTAGLS